MFEPEPPSASPVVPDASPTSPETVAPVAGGPTPGTPAPARERMSPIAAGERLAEMDILRGFALLGILLMNIEFFTRPMQGLYLGFDRSLEGIDRLAGLFVATFVQGKFYTLFSMLFGMGFAVQLARAESRGAGFRALYLRRLGGLAAFGALHGYLLWAGDILLVYALMGLLLLLWFRKTPVGRLPKWAIALMLLPMLFVWGMVSSLELAKRDPATWEKVSADLAERNQRVETEYAAAAEVYGRGSWSEAQPQRAADMNQQLTYLPFFGWSILGMFALGAWFVRSGVIVHPGQHLAFYRRFLAVGLGLGGPLAVVATSLGAYEGMRNPTWTTAVANSILLIANALLSLGYLSGVVLAAQRPAWRERLRPLAQAGKMALTNYLLQSVIATTIFYGHGFELFGRVPRATQLLLALAIWIVNVAGSVWWLRRFRFGPAEWLWRTVTYGRLQPMRLEPPAPAPA